ncbi:hypothetical protein THMIRHAT_04160 [Thiosulfativibrio zosterae]|uniref:Type II secretion system protein GspH n=2 Tax=Thiosulfativibrio zosterae TaxID=2675053 RepID=A0A6F8PKZ6_9GAMM|nr:hypothetical protein THMIRHAT_04160 [Thiosulfativibrio zosterae]
MNRHSQQGFTLIELMVVVLIVAVLLAVGMVSMAPNDSALLRQQVKQVQGALQQTCDQAAFSQHMMALVPSDKGLEMLEVSQGQWQAFAGAKDMAWLAGIRVTWQADETVAKAQKLTRPGWICWPSGEILPGEMRFQSTDLKAQLSWNPILRFELKQ